MNPPPIHEYWNYHNILVLFAVIPIMLAIGPVSQLVSNGYDGYGGLEEFADSENSPMKSLSFGEPQLRSDLRNTQEK